MTRLMIDRQEMRPIPPGLDSLDQVLRHVEDHHLPPETAIRDVLLDGHPALEPEGEALVAGRIDNRERIEILTCPLAEIAADSIREALAYLGRVEIVIHSLARDFVLSPGAETLAGLKQVYDGFYWLTQLLDRLSQSFVIPLDLLPAGKSTALECHQELITILKRLMEAHGKRDFARVAEILKSEIQPIVPTFKEVLAAVRARIVAA